MIVSLSGRLIEATPSRIVLDVGGVGFELGVSGTTASEMPPVGTDGVSLLVRMVVREDSMTLFGFATAEERSLFDRLTQISGVGPKLALSVLSTFSPSDLASVVITGDAALMSSVPGVGKKLASRLVLELESVFASDAELRGLVSSASALSAAAPAATAGIEADVTAALLAMGFTGQEAALAIEGLEEAGITSVEAAVPYALRRLGGGA